MQSTMAIDLTKRNNFCSQTTGCKTGETTSASLVQPERQLVWDYAEELNSNVDPDRFFDYYDERQWEIGGEPVRDWKALFRSWNAREYRQRPKKKAFSYRFGEQPVKMDDVEDFMRDDRQQEELNRILNKIKNAGNANAQ